MFCRCRHIIDSFCCCCCNYSVAVKSVARVLCLVLVLVMILKFRSFDLLAFASFYLD